MDGCEVRITDADGSTLWSGTDRDLHRQAEAIMKNTPADLAVRDRTYRVAADELRQFVERYERLAAEKQDVAEQQKAVMAEAKGRGYDCKVLRRVIALRKRDADDVAEEEAVLELYKAALGM